MKTFIIGATENPRIEVSVLSYERTPTGEFYDDNWVNSAVSISAGGFTGQFAATFTTQDFVQFRAQLQPLFDTLIGQAQFNTLENQLEFTLVGNGRGGIDVTGCAIDHLGGENELRFGFSIDQTHLPQVLRGLNDLISEFPTRPA